MSSLSLPANIGVSALVSFRKSCGLDSPLVLRCRDLRRPGESQLAYQFDAPFVLIGRSTHSELVLDDHRVSRRHAMIQVIAGRLFCLDLESRTHLRWGQHDEPRSRGWLDPGQGLRVGPFQILGPTAGPSEGTDQGEWDPLLSGPPGPSRELEAPGVQLEMPIRTGQAKSLWRVEGQMAMVGRSDSNQLILSHENISKFHAAFIRTESGLWVVDLRARHGILVNGIRVRWAWLDDGDQVSLGPFGLKVRYDSQPGQLRRRDVPLAAGSVGESSVAAAGLQPSRGGAGTSLAVRAGGMAPGIPGAGPNPGGHDLAFMSRGTAWESSLALSSRQTAMWQQQMQAMESFHHEMILMMQMFAAMHREHVHSVRDELDQVRRLTKELGELQKCLVSAPAAVRPEPAPSAPDRGAPASAASPAAPKPVSANDRHSPSPCPAGDDPPWRRELAGRPTVSPGSPIAAPRATPPPSLAREADELAVHSALCQRIAAIQSERQGYWKKILGAIRKE